MKTIENLEDLAGKKVLVRCDFNVPLDGDVITDDGRIKAALPTLKLLLEKNAKLIIMAHLGRPKGEFNMKYSLKPVAKRLEELIGKKVVLSKDVVGPDSVNLTSNMGDEIILLENVRFEAAETSKDDVEREEFAKKLSKLADIYVSDGFGVVHRKQASVYDITSFLPSTAGLLVAKEVNCLSKAIDDPQKPLTVVLGGAKVSDKLSVIDQLITKADHLIIGGGMAWTFIAAMGMKIGKSLFDETMVNTCKGYIEKAESLGVKFHFPIDAVCAKEIDANAQTITVDMADGIPDDYLGLDIGPKSCEAFRQIILDSKTLVWNGPMGVFEIEKFAKGTIDVINDFMKAHDDNGAFTIVGGGDSAAAVRTLGFNESSFSHISTGGGASLEFLEGKNLPGLSVLK